MGTESTSPTKSPLASRMSGQYSGDLLLGDDISPGECLIDKFLWKNDNSILFGREKSGKSILAQQLAFSLTTGEPFLGEFPVKEPLKVAYLQAEGKIQDTQLRVKRMYKFLSLDPQRFRVFFYPGVAFDTQEGYKFITQEIDSWTKPDVVIIDPLYMFMAGDMTSDLDARRMVLHIRQLMEYYNSTHLIVHHAHRPKREGQSGKVLVEGDEGIFGSFVWKAFVDQVFRMERLGKRKHKLTCETTRMAQSIEGLELEMVEPDPLFFRQTLETSTSSKGLVLGNIPSTGPTTVQELTEKTGLSERAVWYQVGTLLQEGKLVAEKAPGKATLFSKVVLVT